MHDYQPRHRADVPTDYIRIPPNRRTYGGHHRREPIFVPTEPGTRPATDLAASRLIIDGFDAAVAHTYSFETPATIRETLLYRQTPDEPQ